MVGGEPADQALAALPGQADSQPGGRLRRLAIRHDDLGQPAAVLAADVEAGLAVELMELDPPQLGLGLGLGQLAGEQPPKDLSHLTCLT